MSRKSDKQPVAKRGNKKLAVISFFSILTLVTGIVLAVVYFAVPFFKEEGSAPWDKIVMWSALVFTAVGFIAVIICIIAYRIDDKRQKKLEAEAMARMMAEAERLDREEAERKAELEREQERLGRPIQSAPVQPMVVTSPVQLEGDVTYIPSKEAYQSINMGQYQSVEEKFDQISKMDRTQFVIYVARLFSRKGYQVKLTPVMDNHDIDMLVEKMGVTIAVGCLLSSRILCKEDIVCVKNGRSYYGVNNSMALTNMYFDRTALDYAKAEHMSLVDRNILAEDFMN
ncbi:MAG: restriction endonuclease [Clostridiales bacterium]|nr:restriction endonuclease [Clostridiales bacterium]